MIPFKKSESVLTKHKNLCAQCSTCCYVVVRLNLSGVNFIPVAQRVKDLNEADRNILSMYVCEHLDAETKTCKNYSQRPEQCRKFFCDGNPRIQYIDIKGEMNSGVQAQ